MRERSRDHLHLAGVYRLQIHRTGYLANDAYSAYLKMGAPKSLRPEQVQQLASLIGFKDPVFRVVSVGQSGDAKRTVQLVFRQTGAIPQLITWKEF